MPPYKEYKFRITADIEVTVWASSEESAEIRLRAHLADNTDYELIKS